jgi:hypothetical protein
MNIDQLVFKLLEVALVLVRKSKLAGGPGPEIIIVTLLVHCIMIYLF